jgi:hypothetical protein
MKGYLAVKAAPDSRRSSGIIDKFHMMWLKKTIAHGLQLNVMSRSPLHSGAPCPIRGYLDTGKGTDVPYVHVRAD